MFNVKLLEADQWANPGALAKLVQASTVRSRFYTAVVFNTAVTAQYIQLHDSATTPAGGAVPLMCEKVSADGQGSLDFTGGRQCQNGIFVGISSTAATYTAAAGTDCLIDVGYRKNA